MKSAFLLFPHHLFRQTELLRQSDEVILVEEWLFFRQYNFHKQKIAFHRASMQFYADFLRERGIRTRYIASGQEASDLRKLLPLLKNEGFSAIHCYESVDNWLQIRLTKTCAQHSLTLLTYESPLFLNTSAFNHAFFADKKRFFQTDYYIQQRKTHNLLLDQAQKPVGGKWSFDAENRKKFPSKHLAPTAIFPAMNAYHLEAEQYVNQYFAANIGELNAHFIYPVTFAEAEAWLEDFLTQRLRNFGTYEDAIVRKEYLLYHSLISPLVNVGLLDLRQTLSRIEHHAYAYDIPLNDTEGLVRQLIGWREFIRAVYELKGVQQRKHNFWNFERRPLPQAFYTGSTGILPVDETIKKLLRTGYCHHIERLMVLGNFMLLCEIHPDEVYKWFMELFIDAYDWVMVPNVYGMSQFADGGVMSTKPYISGSNYLAKMSDYPKDGKWEVIWDALFWRFMDQHRDFFGSNPRLGMLLGTFDKMDAARQRKHLDTAENFLQKLYSQSSI